MKNDKIKELKDNEIAQATGGMGNFEQVSGSLAGTASRAGDHNMPKPTSDEKYIMTTSGPTSPEIIEELRS